MKITKKGLTLDVFEDKCIESPREYYSDENISKMICFHNRYDLGDKHNFKSPKEFREWYTKNKDKIAVMLPLYLYDHSGLTISTREFHDPWDSGQIGYIYTTFSEANRKGYKTSQEMQNRLLDEVLDYDKWVSGIPLYYSFDIKNKNGEILECAGVFEFKNLKTMLKDMQDRVSAKYSFLFDELLKAEQEQCL